MQTTWGCRWLLIAEHSIKHTIMDSDSLSNKFDELKTRISVTKPDIVALTEINPNLVNPVYNLASKGTTSFAMIPYLTNEESVYLLTLIFLQIRMMLCVL